MEKIKQSNIDDKYIIELCINSEGNICHGRPRQIETKIEYKAVKDYLKNRYDDIPQDQFTLNEVIFRIYKGIEHRPVCKVCGKPVKFYKPIFKEGAKLSSYSSTCSKECRYLQSLKTCQETNLEKYGVKSNLQFKDTQEKANAASRSIEAKAKKKNTMLSKYGREIAFDTIESREKAKRNSSHYRKELKRKTNYMKEVLQENPDKTLDDFKNIEEYKEYVEAYLKSKEIGEKISFAMTKNSPNKVNESIYENTIDSDVVIDDIW